MNDETLIRNKLEFQLAVIRELYKHSKIGKKEYIYSTKILDKKISDIKIDNNIKPLNLEIKI